MPSIVTEQQTLRFAGIANAEERKDNCQLTTYIKVADLEAGVLQY